MIAENWYEADLAVVDVETTGRDATTDRVIEIGIVHMRAGEVIESWGRLIDPKREIPAEVVQLTGIQQADVDGQPTFDAFAAEVCARLEGKVFVAYNLEFDKAFVTRELARVGKTMPEGPQLDPLVFARELQRDDGSKRLGKVAARLGIDLTDAHRAINDAEVAGRVLYAFREQLPPRLADLVVLQKQWSVLQEQQMAARRRMRGDFRDGDLDVMGAPVSAVETEDGILLGPAYIYGNEPDPLRFFYSQLPDAGARR